MNTATTILAAGPDWDTGLLGIIAGGMKILAVLVVLGAAFKAIKSIMDGKPGGAFKYIIGAAVLVTFLWEPSLINKLIDAFANLTGSGIEQVDKVVNDQSVVSR